MTDTRQLAIDEIAAFLDEFNPSETKPDIRHQLGKRAIAAINREEKDFSFSSSKTKTSVVIPSWIVNLVDDIAHMTDMNRSEVISMLLVENITDSWIDVCDAIGRPNTASHLFSSALSEFGEDSAEEGGA